MSFLKKITFHWANETDRNKYPFNIPEAIGFKCGFGNRGEGSIRQLAFLRIIRDLEQSGKAQFLIATHSPILMAYPGAVLYNFDGGRVRQVAYEDTDHYQLTKAFLNNKEIFLKQIFQD